MSTLDEERRREYYRIEDSVALEINPLTEAASCTMPRITALFQLLSELHVSEFESQHLLRQLDDRDRVLNGFLKALSKRIDLLGQVVAHTALGELGTPQAVLLSEGGIQFDSAQMYGPGSRLSIKMVLMPQAAGMMLEARVLTCKAKGSDTFEIDTEFVDLPDAQRQLLARHVLQRQAQQRRQAREQGERPD
ncbi:PilZ domain-containing protein [Pseudomonas sp. DTU_2021_1001937_2_SI_NGA_ILE_001]|uniref:PilZ domain-containing protein n=1 Tax=Pseudomonas sp. DTU_2021_1001937_2_SI_NGA_ILE_001 TaxID=3077589 RepID=UPI0025F1A3AD|nr:PilZ domain-containing protein [Pseudomonas sp. DTU_2021_1001937_2_SI_NGA_ILE_001]WNW10866.1 PilZ domain-containing protein [Pseudomonas sp. DTU_2021_1001937_2_SI_NGA_ILE_001]